MPPSRQIPRRHWYIRVEVAIMEFCGRSHDYFSRVKAADMNKILEELPASTRQVSVRASAIDDFMGLRWLRPVWAIVQSASHVNACDHLPAPQCSWPCEHRLSAPSQKQQ